MKVYEAPTLLDAMSSRRHEYETLRDQLLTLKSSFQAIVELDDEFQGKGADAIKGFYGAQIDVVEIWIQLAESNIAFFNGIQGDAEGRNLGQETVELPFLEEDLHQSERRSGEMIAAQQQELQGILNRISDIHPLNVFSRDRFDTHMEEARRQREDTLDSVNRFDEELKREYQHLEVSEQILAGLMRELMESSRQGNHISPLYFNAAAYYSSDAYQLTDDITAQTDSYLKFKESQEQAREPKPIPEEGVNENPLTESFNSFKEIGQDLWAGMEKRNETKFDSVYDFGNYITAGAPDLIKGFASGLNERAEVATDSGPDFINYLTMGGMDLFNGAVNPDDTYSKEHWVDSFGLAALLVGGVKPGLRVKGGTNISTPAPKTVPKVSLNHRWDQIRLGIDELYKRPMMVADNGMLIGGEPGWSRFSVERTVKEREIGTGDRVGTKGTDNLSDPYIGVKQASEYLKSQGVPRQFRKTTLESFEIGTIRLDVAGSSTYGLRFYDNINAYAKGRYLFETFSPQVNRSNLALPPDWNRMTGIQQWQVEPDTIIIKGKAGPQFQIGNQYIGGVEQWYITNLDSLIKP
ncbi:MAG: ribonuclease YeeF family protein [Bacillota bacterium]